jgi:hypothetical protein
MPRELKVHAWTSHVDGVQVRKVVAAHSVAEVLRLSDDTRATYAWRGGVTRNTREIEQAMSDPGTVFWTELASIFRTGELVWHKYSRKEPAP